MPPQRDPRTSLSYSKATSKSMSEGLAEIGKFISGLLGLVDWIGKTILWHII